MSSRSLLSTSVFLIVLHLLSVSLDAHEDLDRDSPLVDEHVEDFLPGEYYEPYYQIVNDYLVENLDDNDPAKNMYLLNKRLSSGEVGARETKVLEKLIEMDSVKSNCTQPGYDILKDNFETTKGRASEPDSPNFRRIDFLINYYCREHAIECSPTIRVTFKGRYRTVDKETVRRIATWMNALLEQHLLNTELNRYLDDESAFLFAEIISKEIKFTKLTDITHRVLKSLLENTIESDHLHFHVDGLSGERNFFNHKVTELLRKWLMNPCKQFVQILGPGLFELAEFNANFHHDVDSREPEFYRAWARYELCGRLIKSEHSLAEDLNVYARKLADNDEKREQL